MTVLGELALLTGERRSAGVRARRDTTVLEVPRDGLRWMLADTDPAASRQVLTQVAERLRTAESARAGPASAATEGDRRRGSAPRQWLRRGRRGAACNRLAAAPIGDPPRRRRPGRAGPRRGGARPGAARGRRRRRPTAEPAWRDFCLRQADAVVLVARAERAVPTEAGHARAAPQPELVLVGPAPAPHQRAAWVAATDAWQLTLRRGRPGVDLRALADRLAGRSLGLVLAGGGARAFAHVGVLLELADAGLHVDRVAGSSIGADRRRPCTPPGIRGERARGRLLRRVRPPPAVQRLAAADRTRWRTERRVRDALVRALRRRRRDRGPAPPAAHREHRPGHPHPPGAPTRRPGGRGQRVGPAAGAVRADRRRRGPTARRRWRPRQPSRRPAHRARRGTGGGGEHLDGRCRRPTDRRARPARPTARPRPRARRCCGP